MRYHHIRKQLNEINMGPGHLRQAASRINAKVGMEYEMYVPNAAVASPDEHYEPDYDQDRRPDDIDDVIDFFSGGELGIGPSERRRLRDKMMESYSEYVDEKFNEDWADEKEDAVREKVMDRWDKHEAIANKLEEMGLDSEQINAAVRAFHDGDHDNPLFNQYMEALDGAREDLEDDIEYSLNREDDDYQEARDEFQDQWEGPSERDWLREAGLHHMSDVADEYRLDWPYYNTAAAPEGSESIEEVAEEFQDMIGRPVKFSDQYHGAQRDGVSYVVEPDGSLDFTHQPTDGGLEFVSPPLSLADAFEDLQKIKQWADAKGCYTNSSTGLHINVSVEGYAFDRLDYVKLALLLGDRYVLEQFGREANTYCKSAIEKVIIGAQETQASEEKLTTMFNSMRNHLELSASKSIHGGFTNKFTSINTKDGYIEFRSPGGDWLGDNFAQIEKTVLRFVVALDSAIHPEKDRQEYLKKLYKLLAVKTMNDPIAYFARFAAGELPRTALKSFIKAIRLTRQKNNPQQAVGSFTGRWNIMGVGRDDGFIYDSVGGIGNTQQAAQQYLEKWLRRYGASPADYVIVPEMK